MRGIALSMFVLAVLPMVFVRPMAGLILWIWFSYMNPHKLTYGFARDFPWVFLVASITLLSLLIHPQERQPITWKPITRLLLLFLIWTGVTTIFAVKGDLAFQQWVIFLKVEILVFATLLLVTNERRLHQVLWIIVISFGFWGLKGGIFTLLKAGRYQVFGPFGSFFQDNNDFALVLCMTLPLMRYLQLRESRRWLRMFLWGLMLISAISILGTYSRGGLLALSVVVFMLALKSRKRIGLIFALVLVLAAAVSFMPTRWVSRMHTIETVEKTATTNESARGRINSWEFATNVALTHPVFGGGFDVWKSNSMWDRYGPPDVVRHRAIHSIFFEVLGEHGFVGLGLYLALIISGWNTLRRVKRLALTRQDHLWLGDLAAMIQVSILGFLAAGSLLPMPYFSLFYQLLGISLLLEVYSERNLARNGRNEGLETVTSVASQPVLKG